MGVIADTPDATMLVRLLKCLIYIGIIGDLMLPAVEVSGDRKKRDVEIRGRDVGRPPLLPPQIFSLPPASELEAGFQPSGSQ